MRVVSTYEVIKAKEIMISHLESECRKEKRAQDRVLESPNIQRSVEEDLAKESEDQPKTKQCLSTESKGRGCFITEE